MKLVFLGTGGYHPNELRHTACLMLPEIGVVLDAGSGMFRLGNYLATERLDIFLTHAHLDHILGLTYLLDLLPLKMLEQVTVHAQAEKLAVVREHLFDVEIFPVTPAYRFEPIKSDCPLPNGGTLTSFPLTHPGGVLGYRLDWPDRSMAYVTDTTAARDAAYIENIRGVDLLVHEAYFVEEEDRLATMTGHSCLEAVAEVAAAAEVGRLVLVHISPQVTDDAHIDLSAARKVFSQIELGTDGMELEF